MNWSLAKGAVVTEQTYISHPVCRTPRDSGSNLKFSIDVYSCDLELAPTHRDIQGDIFPICRWLRRFLLPFPWNWLWLYDSTGVRKLVTFGVEFSASDLAQCERREINGYTHVKVDYELRVCFGSKRGVLDFLCVYKGNDIGRVSVTFDGQHANGVDDDEEEKSCSVMWTEYTKSSEHSMKPVTHVDRYDKSSEREFPSLRANAHFIRAYQHQKSSLLWHASSLVELFQDKPSLERPKAIGNMYAQPISPRGNGKWQMAVFSRKSENKKPARKQWVSKTRTPATRTISLAANGNS
jgi:hypothetical protein